MRLSNVIPRAFAVGAFLLSSAAIAMADDAVTFDLAIKDHKFEPAEIKAPAGKQLILNVKNLDATPEEFESSALRVEKIIVGQGQIIIKLKPLKPGRYSFVGDYHDSTAQGVLIVE
jgi:hypothetical protein